MRIIQVIQKPQLRGAEIFACQLGQHLLELGHDVLIISLFPGKADLPFTGQQIHLGSSPRFRFLDWKGFRELSRIVKEFNPDIVQANAGDTLKYAVLSKAIFKWRTPIIFRNASMISRYIRSSFGCMLNRMLLHRVDHVISVSGSCRSDFIETFDFSPKRVDVIPVGVEISEVPVNSVVPGNYVIHVGGFTFEKNHLGLLRIFKKVSMTKDVELWLVGDGPLRPAVEEYAQKLNLTNSVRFLGARKDVARLISEARGLLLPSIIEGLPAVILEAMYHKAPVVAYNVGGIPEIVKSGVSGWLINQGDEPEFAKAVMQILESSNISQVVDVAYHEVLERFDNRKIAARFVDVYKSVIESPEHK